MSAIPSRLPSAIEFTRHLKGRHLRGSLWQRFFALAVFVGIAALVVLLGSIVNDVVGYRAVQVEVNPATLTPDGRPLEKLSVEELGAIIAANLTPNRQRVLVRDYLVDGEVSGEVLTTTPMRDLLAGKVVPEAAANTILGDLTPEQIGALLAANLGQPGMVSLVNSEIVGMEVLESWTLLESIFQRGTIEAAQAAEYPDAHLEFRSWLTFDFLTRHMATTPVEAGIRTALLGTLWLMVITIGIAFPVGVGAAIYMEEYAKQTRLNGIIETNIRNLAGVPSIIYGLLGLAIFVRTLETFTGGRTVLAGGLTMALLILPVIIINAQEALRAVPSSIREASYGLGATQWQTIWNQVLPAAMPGILTGAILATSRAIGETAPLIVIGAATYITVDPNGPLSKFTVLPIQIYDWVKRPDAQFRDIAASTIVVLLVMLLSLNAAAIVLRQHFKRKLQG